MSKLKSTSTNSMNTFNMASSSSTGSTTTSNVTTTGALATNFAKPAPSLNNKQQQSISADGMLKARTQAKQMECLKDVAGGMQIQQQKKKRTALENISNAGTSSTSGNLNGNKAEVSKKSRYSVFAVGSVIGAKKPAAANTTATTTTSSTATTNSMTLAAVEPKKCNTKENLNNIIPSSFGANMLPAAFNPSLKKSTVAAATTSSNNKSVIKDTKPVVAAAAAKPAANITTKSLSASLVLNKNKEKLAKAESQINEAYMCTESSLIERQLATTTLSSNEALNKLDAALTSAPELVSELKAAAISSAADTITGWEDIDAGELDEFNANDYVTFIFKYYREREERFVIDDYIKRQPHINRQMRLLLVDWMVEVQQQLEFSHEVLYLSVKLLDLYLNGRKVEKEKLQLLGGAAMFIACKFEERMPPIIDDFIYVSDSAYDRKELIKMEIDILKAIQFDIGIPLSYTFLRRYSKCIRADMKFLTLARYILELSLQDYNFAYVRDSVKACASLYLAMQMTVAYEKNVRENGLGDNPPAAVSSANLTSTEWNATLVHYTGSFTKDFIEYVPLMNNLIKTAHTSKYKTIFKKYSHQVFFEVVRYHT